MVQHFKKLDIKNKGREPLAFYLYLSVLIKVISVDNLTRLSGDRKYASLVRRFVIPVTRSKLESYFLSRKALKESVL